MGGYGLDVRRNRLMGILEAALLFLVRENTTILGALQIEDAAREEFMETWRDGVAAFEESAKGVTPAQKVLVGATFLQRALREWREKGATYEPNGG